MSRQTCPTRALAAAMLAGASWLAAPVALAHRAPAAKLSYEAVATADLASTSDAGGYGAGPAPTPNQARAMSEVPLGGTVPEPNADDAGGPPASDAIPARGERRRGDQAFSEDNQGQPGATVHDGAHQPRTYIKPYIEAQQVVDAELSPHHDTLTYSVLAAGVDAGITGRNAQGSVSLRYERQIVESGHGGDADVLSGVARGSVAVVPNLLRIDAAGYASRTNVQSNGAALTDITTRGDTLTQIYSVVGGPTLSTHAGDVKLDGHYHVGYTHVGTPGVTAIARAGQSQADIFGHSTTQDAALRAATRPGAVLPVGLAVEGGYHQEDISDLAQRVRDAHVRGEVIIPVAHDFALVGGVGYEDVKVSSRNAVLDAQGNPVYGADGRLLTDTSSPRKIAFDTTGLTWDAGFQWRPSPRTTLEAHVGRRYGDIGVYGLFSWHPSSRSALNIAVYNNMTGFGGELDSSLINLSNQFESRRNALTGQISPCVASQQAGNCLTGALASVRSTVYRSRGVSSSYNVDFGRLQLGLGAGYDRREYIGAAGTVLAVQNGQVDQNYWVTAFASYALDTRSSLSGSLNAYWFQTGLALNGDLNAVGATAVYQRRIARHLSASAAIGIDSINRQALDDVWTASGSLGMRYTF